MGVRYDHGFGFKILRYAERFDFGYDRIQIPKMLFSVVVVVVSSKIASVFSRTNGPGPRKDTWAIWGHKRSVGMSL